MGLLFSFFLAALSPGTTVAQAEIEGGWATTNDCFLALLMLGEKGRAYTGYLSGEKGEGAWTWDGRTVRVTMQVFDKDSFSGHIEGEVLIADYVWHSKDDDAYHSETCTFERAHPTGRIG